MCSGRSPAGPAPRMPADEDGAAPAQHLHHPMPTVDHGHRAHLPRGDPGGAVRGGCMGWVGCRRPRCSRAPGRRGHSPAGAWPRCPQCPGPLSWASGVSPGPGQGSRPRLAALQGGVDDCHPDRGRRAQEAGGGDDGLPLRLTQRQLRSRRDGGGSGQAQAPCGEALPLPLQGPGGSRVPAGWPWESLGALGPPSHEISSLGPSLWAAWSDHQTPCVRSEVGTLSLPLSPQTPVLGVEIQSPTFSSKPPDSRGCQPRLRP